MNDNALDNEVNRPIYYIEYREDFDFDVRFPGEDIAVCRVKDLENEIAKTVRLLFKIKFSIDVDLLVLLSSL